MSYSVIAAVYKDQAVLQSTLLRSPALKSAQQVIVKEGFATVAHAYEAAARECEAEIMVFAHPDAYLPEAWRLSFERSLAWLDKHDPHWGVIGLFGATREGQGRGFIYSTGLERFVGTPFAVPAEVRVLYEFVFAMRRNSGLSFDTAIPNAQFQLGTTDLCLQAERQARRCYAIPCFALHNSNAWKYMPFSFWKTYLYIRKKWRTSLPLNTTYTTVTSNCLPMIKGTVRGWLSGHHRHISRVQDPVVLYEDLRANMVDAF